MKYLSHFNSQNNESHNLEDHLINVANQSKNKCNITYLKDISYLNGLIHDFGKFNDDWQNYLKHKSGYYSNIDLHLNKINHSAGGGIFLEQNFSKNRNIKKLLQFCILGHHSGLKDYDKLCLRLSDQKEIQLYNDSFNNFSKNIYDIFNSLVDQIDINNFDKEFLNKKNIYQHHYVRYLFSCLIDSDRLDAERFLNSSTFSLRGEFNSIEELKKMLDIYFNSINYDDNDINKIRNTILNDCINGAENNPGFFSLNVPTGGGKTLSSLSFALNHSIIHNKQRIIYVIPYTSIIEQTSNVFKRIFGNDFQHNVIEHHSNLDENKKSFKDKLACENWDAPIIVTTNVQLFESLYSNNTSKCRKLHNIANSVIILDEVQMMPTSYLKPILNSLKFLVEKLKCSIVLCSATQPFIYNKIGNEKNAFVGIDKTKVLELMQTITPNSLNINLKRVNIHYDTQEICEDSLIKKLSTYDKYLCILDNRLLCKNIFKKINKNNNNVYHLSNNMCGEHKSNLISNIKLKLSKNEDVKLITTQLVEAGVDIDFPIVFKKISGLDSIIQAAGRCNREGKIQIGDVFVFNIKSGSDFIFEKQISATKFILNKYKNNLNCFDNLIIEEYFKYYYQSIDNFDKAAVTSNLEQIEDFKFKFETVSNNFKLIDDNCNSIIIKYNNDELLKNLENNFDFLTIRKLQRYTVNVSKKIFEILVNTNKIKEVNGCFIQNDDKLYDNDIGLNIEGL